MLYFYIVIVSTTGVLNYKLFGTPVFSWFFLVLSCITILSVLQWAVNKSKVPIILLILTTIIAVLSSVIQGWDFSTSCYNAFLYTTPLLFLFLPNITRINLVKVCISVQIATTIAFVISILVYLGYIDSGLVGYAFNLNILVLDNSIGLIGLATSLYLLITQKVNTIYSVSTIIFSILIVFLGQSRTRIILSIIIITFYVLFILLSRRKGKLRNIFLVVFVATALLIVIYRNYTTFSSYMSVFTNKYANIMKDSSSQYRLSEIKMHLETLVKNPIFGIGCGALNKSYSSSIDIIFYGHCMLTAAFALNGVFFGTVFNWHILSMVNCGVKNMVKLKSPENTFALVLILTVIVLSVSNAGFLKYSTHIATLMIGILFLTNNKQVSFHNHLLNN